MICMLRDRRPEIDGQSRNCYSPSLGSNAQLVSFNSLDNSGNYVYRLLK
jgi:hypothetical protein